MLGEISKLSCGRVDVRLHVLRKASMTSLGSVVIVPSGRRWLVIILCWIGLSNADMAARERIGSLMAVCLHATPSALLICMCRSWVRRLSSRRMVPGTLVLDNRRRVASWYGVELVLGFLRCLFWAIAALAAAATTLICLSALRVDLKAVRKLVHALWSCGEGRLNSEGGREQLLGMGCCSIGCTANVARIGS